MGRGHGGTAPPPKNFFYGRAEIHASFGQSIICISIIMFLKEIVFKKVLKSFRRVLKSKNSLKS
jgi:hypothetical protein